MGQDGVDMSTIEYHIVRQHYDQAKYPAKIRAQLSSFLKERLAAAQEKYTDRFIMMADIPFMDIKDAVAEVGHARELGTWGKMVWLWGMNFVKGTLRRGRGTWSF